MLHGAEGPVRGGGAGSKPDPTSPLLGESQRPPERKGEDLETPATASPEGQQGPADSEPQTDLRVVAAAPRPGHDRRGEARARQEDRRQEAKDLETADTGLWAVAAKYGKGEGPATVLVNSPHKVVPNILVKSPLHSWFIKFLQFDYRKPDQPGIVTSLPKIYVLVSSNDKNSVYLTFI